MRKETFMPHEPYQALYIHIPFCKSRCGYCDFETSATKRDDPCITEYIEGLIAEIRRYAREGELFALTSIYIGGGTPTHIGSKQLISLIYALTLSIDCNKEGFEFTIEANPESLDTALVKDAWALGVNRISLGVQTFDDGLLRALGRIHDVRQARTAIACAQERFDNVSIDLMCGIPGQTDEMLASSIEEACSLGVSHISVYALSIEAHTPFYRALMEGRLSMPDEDFQAAQMELAETLLIGAGFERYEVSNYAKPGFKSRHNSAYWTGVPYLGIGRGATTMTQNRERRMRVCNGEVVDDLDAAQMAAEDLMLGMRLSRGVSDEALESASKIVPGAPEAFKALKADGLVVHSNGRWRPTKRGWLCGNDLYGRILDLAP